MKLKGPQKASADREVSIVAPTTAAASNKRRDLLMFPPQKIDIEDRPAPSAPSVGQSLRQSKSTLFDRDQLHSHIRMF